MTIVKNNLLRHDGEGRFLDQTGAFFTSTAQAIGNEVLCPNQISEKWGQFDRDCATRKAALTALQEKMATWPSLSEPKKDTLPTSLSGAGAVSYLAYKGAKAVQGLFGHRQ